jgi:hypothetical protein
MAGDQSAPASPEGNASTDAPAPESQSEPHSLADTKADVKQVLGSQQPQGKTRLNLSDGPSRSARADN